MAERSRPVIWSSNAQTDLSEIWSYYFDAAGRVIADKIAREIAETTHLLEDHPFAGRSRDEVREELRSIAVRPHVIFYRVIDNRVEIVRVIDGRRDIEEIFSPPAKD
ncbi:MAG: type II toxin-antitoxin system RelE/ParE family toxin [Pseudolabrys sp.]|nr:type II toxin-antitoxin system RelE/ParE family toxin [Pseudolabrys sp.]